MREQLLSTVPKDKPLVKLCPSSCQPSKAEKEEDIRIDTTPECLLRAAVSDGNRRHQGQSLIAHLLLLMVLVSGPGAAQDCLSLTDERKEDAVLAWIAQHYEWAGATISGPDEDNLLWADFDLYPDGSGHCVLKVMVDDACGVAVVEVVEGDAC